MLRVADPEKEREAVRAPDPVPSVQIRARICLLPKRVTRGGYRTRPVRGRLVKMIMIKTNEGTRLRI